MLSAAKIAAKAAVKGAKLATAKAPSKEEKAVIRIQSRFRDRMLKKKNPMPNSDSSLQQSSESETPQNVQPTSQPVNSGMTAQKIASLIKDSEIADLAGEAVESILKNKTAVESINTAFSGLDTASSEILNKFKDKMKEKKNQTPVEEQQSGGRRRRKTRKIRKMNYYRKRAKTKQRKYY